jgi:hypothetical protein
VLLLSLLDGHTDNSIPGRTGVYWDGNVMNDEKFSNSVIIWMIPAAVIAWVVIVLLAGAYLAAIGWL